MRLIFLDTETTDRDEGARLIQLAYKIYPDNIVVNEFFKPPVPISIEAMSVHHITNEKIATSPTFAESQTKTQLIKEIEQGIIIAHNAMFDVNILKNEGVIPLKFIDTLNLSRHLIKSPQHKLQYLRYLLKLDTDEMPAHDALGDITVLEKLFWHLKALVEQKYSLTHEEDVINKMFELNQTPVLLENITFGKYRGRLFKEIATEDPGYLEWLLNSEIQKNISEQNKDLVVTLKNLL